MVKNFMLDTNILLSSPEAIYGFDDNNVYISGTVLQELDSKKTAPGELGFKARQAIKMIDELMEKGNLVEGVPLGEGKGFFYVEPDGVSQNNLPNGFDIASPDNKIISSCVHLKAHDTPVILVTNDISMKVAASVILGSDKVQSYRNTIVVNDDYTGHRDEEVDYQIINELYANKHVDVTSGMFDHEFCENEFITLHSGTQSALSVYRRGRLESISKVRLFGGVEPMNKMQTYAAWALTQPADELPLVLLSGPAGTAKTYLSVSAGLSSTYTSQRYEERDYYKMLISRPNSEAGDNGFGFLPGDLEAKMGPLLAPYMDNLEALFSADDKEGKGKYKEDMSNVKMQIDDLFAAGIIEVCALSYIRGRSLRNSYIICDEAQNATRALLKDVISRCGMGSKVVVAGDPRQCDNPRLGPNTNGLVYAIDRWKDSSLAATITFDAKNSVRSPLAKEAIERM